jgi:transposase
MSSKYNTAIASVIGIDIGKNSFHIVGQDQRGPIVLRQKGSRGQVEAKLAVPLLGDGAIGCLPVSILRPA